MKTTLHPVEVPELPNMKIQGGPRFNTTELSDDSGATQGQGNWDEALWQLTLHFIRHSSDFGTLMGFYLARRGPLYGFWVTDPLDNSDSDNNGVGMVKTLDGKRYLTKQYPDGFSPYYRIIRGAIADSIVFSADVTGTPVYVPGTGEVTGATADGAASFSFRVPAKFATDMMDMDRDPAVGEWANVICVELPAFTIAS